MKQDIVKVDWLLFQVDARAVERRLLSNPHIRRADVNPINGLAVVAYDESQIGIADIKRIVAECGYHCRGEIRPRYLTK